MEMPILAGLICGPDAGCFVIYTYAVNAFPFMLAGVALLLSLDEIF